MLGLAVHQQLGVDVPGVEQVIPRQQPLGRQRRMDRRAVRSTSEVTAGVVSTFVIRWTSSPSHVSVRWTLYPVQVVLRLLPNVASGSYGESIR